jgi:hypothetical protein
MGKQDVVKHCHTQGHQDQAQLLESQSRIRFNAESNETLKRTVAELKIAVLTATSNIPMAFHDSLSPTINKVFPDSGIACKYRSASTKATCMLNLAVAPMLVDDLVQQMKTHPYSLSTDGSNDTGLHKMNPAMVRIYDIKENRIVTRFLDMCPSTSSTAEAIYSVLNDRLANLLGTPNPWSMCTSVGVDNTSVNIGVHNSLKTRIELDNPAIYFNGCPCHIIHNAARKASDCFCDVCAFDVEELCIDLYYWFEKSTKRKNGLQSYCTFCDQDYRSIVKHVTTRWLSLERAVERTLKQYSSLRSYFLSESETLPRFVRLQKLFGDPMTEIYLLFFQSVLPCFTRANQFLQREEPLIHILQPQLLNLLKKILAKFLKVAVVSHCLNDGTLVSVDYKALSNQVTDKELAIGFSTKQTACQLHQAGDITSHQLKKFYKAGREFLIRATEYLMKWCPLNDELLTAATWLIFEDRLEKNFMSVEYFVYRYPVLFSGMNMDQLSEQFLNYQMLPSDAIPKSVKESVNLQDDDPHRVDTLWGYLRGMKAPGTNDLLFGLLFKVAEIVMTIPHSNAGEERIFSLINKNKTPSRSSLQLDGTLSSLIVVKTHIDNPIQWTPPEAMVQKAKGATRAYNEQHKSHS